MESLPNMSDKKAQELIDKYFEANMTAEDKKSEDMKKTMAGLTGDEVKEASFANKAQYVEMVTNKLKMGMAPDTTLGEDKNSLYVAFYNDTNYYDLSRPQAKIEIADKRAKIHKQLVKVDPNEKVLIIFGGNLLGEEWKLANLRNASVYETDEVVKEISKAIKGAHNLTKKQKENICDSLENFEDSTEPQTKKIVDRIVAYWGIKKRVEQLRNDIRTYISVANALGFKDYEIILLNGAQEHAVKQKFNFDALEKVHHSVAKHYGNVKYIDAGVNITFPIYTDNKGQSSSHIRMTIQTNSSSKASKASRVASATNVDSGKTDAPVAFRLNVANFSGYYDGVYYPTGQALFEKVKKGANPPRAPQDRDVYKIDITGNDQAEVTRGGTVNFADYALEHKTREQKIKNEAMAEVITEAINQRVNSMILNLNTKGEQK